jgi:hypothetical protein
LRLMSAWKERKCSRPHNGDGRGESESQSGTESHISYFEPWVRRVDRENTVSSKEVEEPNWAKVRTTENCKVKNDLRREAQP